MLSTFVVNQVVIRNQNMYIINSFLIIMCVYYYVYNKGNGDGNTVQFVLWVETFNGLIQSLNH